ncbi:hypothetical protein LTR70_002878 [Exophiala xenobiotica]|uniref:AB hydrolase-1 domain-containing protein n=1 Tax=Lithohypha guttulata TaxID=1690604 RepID=A0ABR0KI44_9EURO|nr:hypothetical protein LTR24_002514 [Lithohypha guttulata]KAK5324431.1 hypothetical protein LTR70_002878 [Exophiala xenobiotica]
MVSTKPVMVIVPGGFCSPQTYEHVEQLLHQQGYETIIPNLTVCGDLSSKTAASREWRDMAEKGVADDVKLIHSLLLPLLDQGRKAVIVAHSYGSVPAMLSIEGQTVSERAERNSIGGIIAYVNVSGFAHPARGKNVFGSDDEPPLMPYHVLEEGILHLSEEAKPLFFSDLSPTAQDTAWSKTYKTQSHKSLLTKPDFIESDIKIPKTYLLCQKDRTVAPAYQESFIKAGGFDNVVNIASGHFPFISMPEDVVKAVLDASQE